MYALGLKDLYTCLDDYAQFEMMETHKSAQELKTLCREWLHFLFHMHWNNEEKKYTARFYRLGPSNFKMLLILDKNTTLLVTIPTILSFSHEL